jgi:hypothetical protein
MTMDFLRRCWGKNLHSHLLRHVGCFNLAPELKDATRFLSQIRQYQRQLFLRGGSINNVWFPGEPLKYFGFNGFFPYCIAVFLIY